MVLLSSSPLGFCSKNSGTALAEARGERAGNFCPAWQPTEQARATALVASTKRHAFDVTEIAPFCRPRLWCSASSALGSRSRSCPVSYTHLRAHETDSYL